MNNIKNQKDKRKIRQWTQTTPIFYVDTPVLVTPCTMNPFALIGVHWRTDKLLTFKKLSWG